VEDSCKYIGYAVIGGRQGVVLQLGSVEWGLTTCTVKVQLVMKCCTGPQIWQSLVNTVVNLQVPEGNILTN